MILIFKISFQNVPVMVVLHLFDPRIFISWIHDKSIKDFKILPRFRFDFVVFLQNRTFYSNLLHKYENFIINVLGKYFKGQTKRI